MQKSLAYFSTHLLGAILGISVSIGTLVTLLEHHARTSDVSTSVVVTPAPQGLLRFAEGL